MSEIIPNVVVSMPSQLFTMARSFKAASNGRIYIGKIDTDPTIPENQIQVYVERENGDLVPAPQPIIINTAGFPVYNGQIAKFVTIQGHSMAIYDGHGVQHFYFSNILKYDPDRLRAALLSDDGANNIHWGDDSIGSVIDQLNLKTESLNDVNLELDGRLSRLDSEIAYSSDFKSLHEWASIDKKHKILVGGEYEINETLIIKCESLSTNGTVVLNVNSDINAIQLGQESLSLLGTLKNNLPKSAISFESYSSFSDGDTIAILDMDNGSYHKSRDYYKKGEFFTVRKTNGDTVFLSNPSNDDYRSGCHIYKINVSNFKKLSGNFIINNKSDNIETRNAAFLIIQAFNAKLSNLKIDATGYSSALILKNCKYVDSVNLSISNRSDGFQLSETDYAVSISNCEYVNLNGFFLSDRHAVAHGGSGHGAPIVNRFCNHSGTFATSGLGLVQAADFHANTENCSFSGYMNGVSLGGHNNSITRSVIDMPNNLRDLPAITGAEMKSINHDISFNTIATNGNPDSIYRGVIDFGGNSHSYNEYSDRNGMLKINNNYIYCFNAKTGVRIINRGSQATTVLNLSNNFIINDSNSVTSIRVEVATGANFRAAVITGCVFTPGTKPDISGCDEIIN
ncbi:hypothetical protein XBP1_2930019 [Xenorhabdus bovienii str. puntauvense]|uniref:Bacteriophage P22 tailspike N-terminal domain-containing protein n=1 Tax=Xenorhabdus bovienii str. puntauvense TaxID=1398201 RepID=A0A077NJN0_XENBV|nr:phage head-binding domain-containing protein [Xenorhabdus bovienii]CDG98055.1 hypothetical protein XBP1_2930019 [Xenorhabdus bovienii str. puntauvense]